MNVSAFTKWNYENTPPNLRNYVWSRFNLVRTQVADDSVLSFLKLFIFDPHFCELFEYNRERLSEADLKELLWYFLDQVTFTKGYGPVEMENYKCLLNYVRPSDLTKPVVNRFAYPHLVEDKNARIPYNIQTSTMANVVFNEAAARSSFLHPDVITDQMKFTNRIDEQFQLIKDLEYQDRVQALKLYDSLQEIRNQLKFLRKKLLGLKTQREMLWIHNCEIADFEEELDPSLGPNRIRSLPSVALCLSELENTKDITILEREIKDSNDELFDLIVEFRDLLIDKGRERNSHT